MCSINLLDRSQRQSVTLHPNCHSWSVICSNQQNEAEVTLGLLQAPGLYQAWDFASVLLGALSKDAMTCGCCGGETPGTGKEMLCQLQLCPYPSWSDAQWVTLSFLIWEPDRRLQIMKFSWVTQPKPTKELYCWAPPRLQKDEQTITCFGFKRITLGMVYFTKIDNW